MDEQGIPQDEENFEEAIRAVNLCVHKTGIPSKINRILSDSKCINVTHQVKIAPFLYNVNMVIYCFCRVSRFG